MDSSAPSIPLPTNAEEYRVWFKATYPNIEYGRCVCGCGEETKRQISSSKTRLHFRDEPTRFVSGHNGYLKTRTRFVLTCPQCKMPFEVCKSGLQKRYCSKKCYTAAQFTGFINSDGYRVITVNDRQIKEHRHVMEQHLGRKLRPDENVHHRNLDKLDNRVDNLEVMPHATHSILHGYWMGWSRKYGQCIYCGNTDYAHHARGFCKRCYQIKSPS